MSAEKIHTIFKSIAPAATFLIGIIFGAFGIDMLYKKTTATISTVSFSVGLLLLIIGLVLILVALFLFPKTRTTEQSPVRSWLSRNWLILLGILIGVVLLVVFFSLHYDPAKDKGKYDILVNLILIIIGITAAVGYGIYKWISHNIEQRVERIAYDNRNVARAEVQTNLSFMWFQNYETEKEKQKEMKELHDQLNEIRTNIGVKHKEETKTYSMPTPMDYLKRATTRAVRALESANKLDKKKYEELICRCKSNLAYYLTERGRKKRDFRDKNKALELSLYAFRAAKRKRALGYLRPYNWEETYAWVLWHFADDDVEAKQKARDIIHELEKRADIPHSWRERIKKKWAPLFINE